MTEDAAIAIDRTTLQSVYSCTHQWHSTVVRLTEPILPGELSVVMIPSYIRPSKQSPLRRDSTGTVKCPRVATRESL
jgi:hypothetical protein